MSAMFFQNPDEQFLVNEVENEIALVGENTGMKEKGGPRPFGDSGYSLDRKSVV